jgi:hypothetical protein
LKKPSYRKFFRLLPYIRLIENCRSKKNSIIKSKF